MRFNPLPPSNAGEKPLRRSIKEIAAALVFNPLPPSNAGERGVSGRGGGAATWLVFNPLPPSNAGESKDTAALSLQLTFQSAPAFERGRKLIVFCARH